MRGLKRALSSDPLLRIYEWYAFRKFLRTAPRADDLRLHLACGPRVLDGWVNIDAHIRPRVLTMKLPRGLRRLGGACARYIYTSHFLEHLEYPQTALAFVRECHRLLIPGGVIRLVVPGIEKIIRAYVADNQAFFKIQADLHPAWCTTKLEHLMYALQLDGAHKYGYDLETLQKVLSQAGFREVCASDYNQSPHDELRIDYRSIPDDAGGYLSLYVEAIK